MPSPLKSDSAPRGQGEFNFAQFVPKTGDAPPLARQPSGERALRQTRAPRSDPKGQFGARQANLDFADLEREEGYTQWLAGRRLAADALARQLHLPLGHPVEVWLANGIRLRGRLRLAEEALFVEEDRLRHLELVVDGVAFTYREMESCVRLD
jgi:hypothetical protein